MGVVVVVTTMVERCESSLRCEGVGAALALITLLIPPPVANVQSSNTDQDGTEETTQDCQDTGKAARTYARRSRRGLLVVGPTLRYGGYIHTLAR